jgi:hypothetical protein
VDFSRLHFALRGIRTHFSDLRILGSIVIVGLLLGFAGPFGTMLVLPLVQRVVYWTAIALLTYFVGVSSSRIVRELFGLDLPQAWQRVLLYGALTSLPITLTVIGINIITFGPDWQQAIDPVTLWVNATVGAVGIAAVAEIISASVRSVPSDPPPAVASPPSPTAPALLERLPLPVRGRLWALVVSDHYVEVWTERGTHLVLMRLSDAIKETSGEPGLQIHRSHWVALGAVKRTLKSDGKPMVELPDGRRLPISRSYLDAARSAGLA